MRIGFVGLGLMGSATTHNVIKAGLPLIALARQRRDALELLLAEGRRKSLPERGCGRSESGGYAHHNRGVFLRSWPSHQRPEEEALREISAQRRGGPGGRHKQSPASRSTLGAHIGIQRPAGRPQQAAALVIGLR
jgi:hypothetical protein